MHSFLAKQPDLNWENPAVRTAMTDVLDFWLSMGVDGIRADAVRFMGKDPQFRDNPPNPAYREGEEDPYQAQIQGHTRYGGRLFSYLREIADTVAKYPNRIVLFEDYPDETIGIDTDDQYSYFYSVNPMVSGPFNFEGMETPYNATAFRSFIDSFQRDLGGELRPFYCFSNHDNSRLASRVGQEQARLIGLLQLTLPGIPVIYYGDELGMHDVPMTPDQVQDPFELQTPGLGLGRDPERTPMQWSDARNAGFTVYKPWLPIAEDFRTINVKSEMNDDESFLMMYRALLEFKDTAVLRTGEYIDWSGSNAQVFGYSRRGEFDTFLVLLNMSSDPAACTEDVAGEVICSTHPVTEPVIAEKIRLQPHQGVVIRRSRTYAAPE
jgi:alpha-glucosidase